jgi:hypothetical protein
MSVPDRLRFDRILLACFHLAYRITTSPAWARGYDNALALVARNDGFFTAGGSSSKHNTVA